MIIAGVFVAFILGVFIGTLLDVGGKHERSQEN